ncbi:hypothetical protein SynA18461_00682 [Synechococcus sp. A18-46.1]|nr:hypothetical protein SynA18461_00682 [Synechococcus sp. A18-46.1]
MLKSLFAMIKGLFSVRLLSAFWNLKNRSDFSLAFNAKI